MTRTFICRTSDSYPAGTRSKGFTLLEILVVLIIVGIMAGVTLLSAPTFLSYQDFEGETRRIKQLLSMLRDEAIIQGAEFGFGVEETRYQFYRFDDSTQTWLAWSDGPYQARDLPEDMSIKQLDIKAPALWETTKPFSGEDSTGQQTTDQKTTDQKTGIKRMPPILLLSSGEITDFKLAITDEKRQQVRVLVSNGYGDLLWDEAPTP
ncbi:MAG: type II secretion system minor pseudopilin GspH [Gammaproteobacteria bacterium]|nr:type II secretion system minor pseudopilin GspH [Gammaproteobacteria bacterium]